VDQRGDPTFARACGHEKVVEESNDPARPCRRPRGAGRDDDPRYHRGGYAPGAPQDRSLDTVLEPQRMIRHRGFLKYIAFYTDEEKTAMPRRRKMDSNLELESRSGAEAAALSAYG